MQKKKYNRLLAPEKEAFITGLTESLADIYFPGDAAIKPSLIAKDYGITWSLGHYEDAFDGLLEHEKGSFHIYVNKDRQQSRKRQRFTFCHELGHFFIDGHRNALANGLVPAHSSFTGFSSEYAVEREADFFAASLLMPKKRVLGDYQQFRRFSFAIVNQFRQKYEISMLATVFRLFHLDVHPMMIVYGQNGKIKWEFHSDDFYHSLKFGKEKVPEDSLMYDYFHHGKQHISTQQLWTGDWFKPTSTTERKLYERCLYYDDTKSCYSVIWEH